MVCWVWVWSFVGVARSLLQLLDVINCFKIIANYTCELIEEILKCLFIHIRIVGHFNLKNVQKLLKAIHRGKSLQYLLVFDHQIAEEAESQGELRLLWNIYIHSWATLSGWLRRSAILALIEQLQEKFQCFLSFPCWVRQELFEALNLMIIRRQASLGSFLCVVNLYLNLHVAVRELWRSSSKQLCWRVCQPESWQITEYLAAMAFSGQVELGLIDGLVFQQ